MPNALISDGKAIDITPTRHVPKPDPAGFVHVTKEMLDAGVEEFWHFDHTTDDWREMLTAVYIAMRKAEF